jgi:hypothetical protein
MCVENPFETAEIIEDDSAYDVTDTLLENPFECSELEYSEDDDDNVVDDDDDRPLSTMTTIRLPAGPLLNLQKEALNWSQRPRSKSQINLSRLNYDGNHYALNAKSHSSNSTLAPPPPELPPRRASFDTPSNNNFVTTVLTYANKQNSVDRAQVSHLIE